MAKKSRFATEAEKLENKRKNARARVARWRARNIEANRARDRLARRRRLAAKAIAEGRQPGVKGRARKLSDEQRLEKARAHCLAYWDKNPEKRKQLARQYYKNNKEKVLAKSRNRRARTQNLGGTHSRADIRIIFRLQKGKCAFCLQPFGDRKPHIDHYVPLYLGGTNDRGNLRLLHEKCNKQKAAMHPIDHALKHGLLCW